MTNNHKLDTTTITTAARELAARIPAFAKVLEAFSFPPLWDRKPGFATLIHIILEQQVSLSSAKAAFEKLELSIKQITPDRFLKLDDNQLLQIGFSRQKARYCRIVAEEIKSGKLELNKLQVLPDEIVKEKLMSITGIGHWTSDIYLLMVLLRPDVWPHGDRALAVSAYEVFSLKEIPDYNDLRKMSEEWKPWRSVAARILWHNYLSTPRKRHNAQQL